MKIKRLIATVLSALTVVAANAQAADLIQVYHQALVSDPAFKEAYATWMAAKEDLPLAYSSGGLPGGGLLPFVDLQGNFNPTWVRNRDNGGTYSGSVNSLGYSLSITQSIFNFATWKSIAGANFTVKAATATYLAASQDLMSRSAEDYFQVLKDYDALRYTLALKQANLHQLVTAEQEYKVGLIAITGVYEAQASYDSSIAQEIADRNTLANDLETLRSITGVRYKSLAMLKNTIPLVIPKPHNLRAWIDISLHQNYGIQSDLNGMLAAHQAVLAAAAGRYPALSASVSGGQTQTGEQPGADTGTEHTTSINGTITLDFPVYRGGYDGPNTKQKEYLYLKASEQLEYQHRYVIENTSQQYLNVDAYTVKIKADQEAIVSARNKLKATQSGYVVGTRTMVDVLNAISDLYNVEQQWSDDRYNYVTAIISLKNYAGTLSPKDLAVINTWLGKSVTFNTSYNVNVSPLATLQGIAKGDGGAASKAGSLKAAQQPPLNSKKGFGTTVTQSPAAMNAVAQLTSSPTNSHINHARIATNGYTKTYYAIQVYAAQNLSEAYSFISHYSIDASQQLHIVRHKQWYRVVYGHYPSYSQAKIYIRELPHSLRHLKPYVVKVVESRSSDVKSHSLQPGEQHKSSLSNVPDIDSRTSVSVGSSTRPRSR